MSKHLWDSRFACCALICLVAGQSLAQSLSSYGTATRLGNSTYYYGSSGAGTATRLGNTTYYYGNGRSGTATRLGNTTYYYGF